MKKITYFLVLSIMFMLSGITVNAKTSIKLNKEKITITKGKSYQLRVKGTKKKVKWTSKNKKIAKVNSKGKVTGKKKGKTTIIAKVDGKKFKCSVTVKNRKYLTEEQALDKLFDWLKKNNKIKDGQGLMSFGKDGDCYVFKHYCNMETHISTINVYYVNYKTGKITAMF